jgi:UDP-N-acetylglucosamine pyrophosphorylase
LVVSGWLEKLLREGIKYLFVSNSDNLGATLDLKLLNHFAESQYPFLMEVAQRTPADRKGGHLALQDGKLILRERAQCPDFDLEHFENIERHRFFNTNNLWIRLDELDTLLRRYDGFIPLPVIKNEKSVEPRDKNSPKVFQLETAMGAAIESFPNSAALVVPRSRFAPVKTTADLFALRSDAYLLAEDFQMHLAPERNGTPPKIDLDSDHYRLVDQLDRLLADGAPSLRACRELTVRGPVAFGRGNVFRGTVKISNPSSQPKRLPDGEYADTEFKL